MDRDRGGARRHTRTAVIAPAIITLAILAANATTNAGNASTTATTSNVAIESTVTALAAPVVGLAATPSGKGYWRVGADGGVLTAGDAIFYGSAAGFAHDTIVAIAATRSGHGYWLTDRQGAVFSFGDAAFHGSMGGKRLNLPIVGMAATPNGSGYWLVASDGGIFAFNAPFLGSTGSIRLNRPITGMAATPNGSGYWLVASDGGIFAFNAPFFGSTGSIRLNQPITGMAAAPNGTGYTMVAADGGLFRFGTNSPFYGSAVGACAGAPAVAVAMSPGATGYWIAFADARTYAFSPSSPAPQCNPSTSSVIGLMAADLFARVNDERAARHLAPVTWDPTLANYAAGWSANMASHGFRHSAIGNLLGPYNYVGENIAAGSGTTLVGSLHNAWMHSDGHRANILAPGFTRMGVGVFCSANGSIWLTEDFGHPSSAGPAQTSSTTPPVDPIARPDSGALHC
ncbi:MAG: CAP domain-containing protein [Actinomycetota bacterium]|nr:CAP domain-containing protein [Actinomycetota bacterium]